MGGTINLTGIPDFDQFEIVKEGTASVTLAASSFTKVTIAHNLGFAPYMLAAFDHVSISGLSISDGDLPLPTWSDITLDLVNHVIQYGTWIQAMADPTNGYIIGSNALASIKGPYTIKYYLIRKRSR
jgi:hypothetical protein